MVRGTCKRTKMKWRLWKRLRILLLSDLHLAYECLSPACKKDWKSNSSDLLGFLIFIVLDPSGTEQSISLDNPSIDESMGSDDPGPPFTPRLDDASDAPGAIELEPSMVGSLSPMLFGTEPSKEEEDALPSFNKYWWSPSVEIESFSLETLSSDVWLFLGRPFLPPLTLLHKRSGKWQKKGKDK